MGRWLLLLMAAAVMVFSTQAQASDASLLGPQGSLGSTSTINNSGTSVPQTGSLLQPAGTSTAPIQEADAQAGGITGSQSETLQQTAPSDQIKLLIGSEGEGEQTLDNEGNFSWLLIILAILVTATIITAVLVWIERRRALASL